MALRRQKRGTGCLSERRALLKICFFSVQFSASANRRHGQLFFVVLFCLCLTSVSRHQNCLQIGYLCIDIFFLANRFHCPYDNVLLKAFIVFFSHGAGFTTMASFFLSTKILKKSKTRLSLLGFLAFISTYKPLSSTKPAKVVFKTTALDSLPLAFSRLWGHKPPCAFLTTTDLIQIPALRFFKDNRDNRDNFF